MKILGTYPSRLAYFHAEELRRIINQAKSEGDFEAGRLADQQQLEALRDLANNLSAGVFVSPGQRMSADSVNHPVSLLETRFTAIEREHADFLTRMLNFLNAIQKDSGLVDALIELGDLETWVAAQNRVTGAERFYWDLSASHGLVASGIPLTDPIRPGVVYPAEMANARTASFLHQQVRKEGVAPPSKVLEVVPISLNWEYTTEGESEVLSGAGWTRLSRLEPKPGVIHAAPAVTQILPMTGTYDWNSFIQVVKGDNPTNLPVFIRIVFLPIRRESSKPAGVPKTFLSSRLLKENLVVHDGTKSYDEGVDFSVDASGNLVWGSHMANISAEIHFTEQYPAYQCSINEVEWSRPILLDELNPHPHGDFVPAAARISEGRFPVTDEAGNHLGFFIRKLQNPLHEYTLVIESARTPVQSSPTEVTDPSGAGAVLVVEFEKPSYMNGITLAPFTSYPIHIRAIQAEGLTPLDGSDLFSGNFLLDKPITVRFERRLVKKLTLHLHQATYTIKEHHLDPAGKQRQDAYTVLQAVLPVKARQRRPYKPKTVTGYQYEIAIKDIRGQDWQTEVTPRKPGFFITGPFRVKGTADIVHLETQQSGLIDARLLAKEQYLDGTTSGWIDMDISPGISQVFASERPGSVEHTDIYLKFILREEFSLLKRYLLQVTHV